MALSISFSWKVFRFDEKCGRINVNLSLALLVLNAVGWSRRHMRCEPGVDSFVCLSSFSLELFMFIYDLFFDYLSGSRNNQRIS